MSDVTNSMEVLDAVNALAVAVSKAKADGHVDWKDLPDLLPVVSAVKKAVDGAAKISDELKTLDAAGAQALAEKAFSAVSALVSAVVA